MHTYLKYLSREVQALCIILNYKNCKFLVFCNFRLFDFVSTFQRLDVVFA